MAPGRKKTKKRAQKHKKEKKKNTKLGWAAGRSGVFASCCGNGLVFFFVLVFFLGIAGVTRAGLGQV